jgi:putative nucleotidyltransferase with HDIG domain
MVETLYDRMGQYAAAPTNSRQAILISMDDLLLGSKINSVDLIAAFPTNHIESSKKILLDHISIVMGTGILSSEYRHTLFRNDQSRKLSIVQDEDQTPVTVEQQDIYSTRKAVEEISRQFSNKAQQKLLNQLLPLYVVDNMTYDEANTDLLRREAADRVEPVIQPYPAGSRIARAGEKATAQTLLLLKEHELKRTQDQEMMDQILETLGNSIILLAGLIITALILRIGNPKIIRRPDQILLLCILSLITLAIARLLTFFSGQYAFLSPLLMHLVPYALAVLLAGILLGGNAAVSLGFWCSFATAVLFDQSFRVFAMGMIITITAASTARNVHRRASLFQAALWICGIKVLYTLILAILSRPIASVLTAQIIAAIISGALSTILTLLFIPLLEKLFKITTDMTLLELSDMGHPLLQKMAMQAPGTYHHSLMVATLAQNAAEAIGANSLLIRVCAYYHDIGKMAKPEFFTENIQHKENPHDELSPHMSALVISSHVKEGLTLAKRHKLPQPILDAIEQHHGNGLISFFYHKAKTLAQEGAGGSMTDVINDSDFRYGGAPAVSPEMAILALADSAEAASRSIEKPTPQKISNMMDDIFAMKIRDGQLDYANLTMAQINVVKQSFTFSLSNMLHGRIPYPKDNDNNTAKPTGKPSAQPVETPKAG